jgi:hypothetical protein
MINKNGSYRVLNKPQDLLILAEAMDMINQLLLAKGSFLPTMSCTLTDTG